jgi:hypothetical protein
MPTDAPDGLINQHVVSPVKARKPAKKAADKPTETAPKSDEDTAAPKSDKAG